MLRSLPMLDAGSCVGGSTWEPTHLDAEGPFPPFITDLCTISLCDKTQPFITLCAIVNHAVHKSVFVPVGLFKSKFTSHITFKLCLI